jgi:hypothetical protein
MDLPPWVVALCWFLVAHLPSVLGCSLRNTTTTSIDAILADAKTAWRFLGPEIRPDPQTSSQRTQSHIAFE